LRRGSDPRSVPDRAGQLGCDYIGQAGVEIVLLGVPLRLTKREDDEANFVAPANCGRNQRTAREGTENSESEYGGETRFLPRES